MNEGTNPIRRDPIITFEDLDAIIDKVNELGPVVTSFIVAPSVEEQIRSLCEPITRRLLVKPEDRLHRKNLNQYAGIFLFINPYVPPDKIIATMSDGSIVVFPLGGA